MPLSFTDQMLDRLTSAASMLPSSHRDGFLRSVANRLSGLSEPTSGDLETAIGFTLAAYGVVGGPACIARCYRDGQGEAQSREAVRPPRERRQSHLAKRSFDQCPDILMMKTTKFCATASCAESR